MKSTKMTAAVQLEQVLDVCVDVSKRKTAVDLDASRGCGEGTMRNLPQAGG